MEKTSYKEIWERLSHADYSSQIRKKNVAQGVSLSYLSWTTAWEILMRLYPDATIEWTKGEGGFDFIYNPIVCEAAVECKITIGGCSRTEQMAVTDSAQRPVKGDRLTLAMVDNQKQRCLVKCLARFGLGLALYKGEDIPGDLADYKQEAKAAIDGARTPEEIERAMQDFEDLTLTNPAFRKYAENRKTELQTQKS